METATIQLLVSDDWQPVSFENLRKWDIFRYATPSSKEHEGIFQVTSDAPYLNEQGILTVEVEPA